MILSEFLKEQYSEVFKSLSNRSIIDVFALLKRTIEFELDKKEYKGLKETVLPSIEQAFEYENIGSVTSLKLLASELEVLMKKVIEISEGNLDGIRKDDKGNIYLKELSFHLRLNNENCLKNVSSVQ